MRRSSAWFTVALLAVPSIAFGFNSPGAEKAEPPLVPYMCNDGQTANVLYESGSDYVHAKALVAHDGRTIELEAAPTLYGVRYRAASAAEGGPILAWSLRGEQALLTEAPDADSYTRQEHELLRCIRIRGAGEAVEGHHGEH